MLKAIVKKALSYFSLSISYLGNLSSLCNIYFRRSILSYRRVRRDGVLEILPPETAQTQQLLQVQPHIWHGRSHPSATQGILPVHVRQIQIWTSSLFFPQRTAFVCVADCQRNGLSNWHEGLAHILPVLISSSVYNLVHKC